MKVEEEDQRLKMKNMEKKWESWSLLYVMPVYVLQVLREARGGLLKVFNLCEGDGVGEVFVLRRTRVAAKGGRGVLSRRFILIPHSPAHAFYRDPRSPALHHELTATSAISGHRRLNQNTPWPRRRQLAPPEPPPATVSTFLSSKTAIPREGLPPPSSPIPSWLATTFYSESKLTANNYPPVEWKQTVVEGWLVVTVSVMIWPWVNLDGEAPSPRTLSVGGADVADLFYLNLKREGVWVFGGLEA
ncbi:hypothetical protein LR48_Vigan02g125400 [Vigna angularis]|uniref:Uncharacterized protein n=1 Tax=Phaseolus angularis TaxID=3914 RepID=A0A0L9TY42_PHAAN|nr:hypothetical protein LR48_Vigan02g125400 [Vigna angularis]